jgi:type VI protein secretion system component Hcp
MILLHMDKCPGDSQIEGHPNWIACSSVSWNVERTFTESAKAGTLDVNVGVADIPPISVNKTLDKASIYLMAAGIAGGSRAGRPNCTSCSPTKGTNTCFWNSSWLTQLSPVEH